MAKRMAVCRFSPESYHVFPTQPRTNSLFSSDKKLNIKKPPIGLHKMRLICRSKNIHRNHSQSLGQLIFRGVSRKRL